MRHGRCVKSFAGSKIRHAYHVLLREGFSVELKAPHAGDEPLHSGKDIARALGALREQRGQFLVRQKIKARKSRASLSQPSRKVCLALSKQRTGVLQAGSEFRYRQVVSDARVRKEILRPIPQAAMRCRAKYVRSSVGSVV